MRMKFKFRRDSDPVANAMFILAQEGLKDPRFLAALAATKASVEDFARSIAALPDTHMVAEIRSRGGWSRIIRGYFDSHIGAAERPGSKLLGPTKLSRLFDGCYIQDIRNDACLVIERARNEGGRCG